MILNITEIRKHHFPTDRNFQSRSPRTSKGNTTKTFESSAEISGKQRHRASVWYFRFSAVLFNTASTRLYCVATPLACRLVVPITGKMFPVFGLVVLLIRKTKQIQFSFGTFSLLRAKGEITKNHILTFLQLSVVLCVSASQI